MPRNESENSLLLIIKLSERRRLENRVKAKKIDQLRKVRDDFGFLDL